VPAAVPLAPLAGRLESDTLSLCHHADGAAEHFRAAYDASARLDRLEQGDVFVGEAHGGLLGHVWHLYVTFG